MEERLAERVYLPELAFKLEKNMKNAQYRGLSCYRASDGVSDMKIPKVKFGDFSSHPRFLDIDTNIITKPRGYIEAAGYDYEEACRKALDFSEINGTFTISIPMEKIEGFCAVLFLERETFYKGTLIFDDFTGMYQVDELNDDDKRRADILFDRICDEIGNLKFRCPKREDIGDNTINNYCDLCIKWEKKNSELAGKSCDSKGVSA